MKLSVYQATEQCLCFSRTYLYQFNIGKPNSCNCPYIKPLSSAYAFPGLNYTNLTQAKGTSPSNSEPNVFNPFTECQLHAQTPPRFFSLSLYHIFYGSFFEETFYLLLSVQTGQEQITQLFYIMVRAQLTFFIEWPLCCVTRPDPVLQLSSRPVSVLQSCS